METGRARLLANTAPMGAMGLWKPAALVLPTLRLPSAVGRPAAPDPAEGGGADRLHGSQCQPGAHPQTRGCRRVDHVLIAPQEWAFRIVRRQPPG